MLQQHGGQRLGKVRRPTALSHVPVFRMGSKELSFGVSVLPYILSQIEIPLAHVHNPDKSATKRDDAAFENVSRIGALVHNINLCQHPKRAHSLTVDTVRELNAIRGGNISVSRRDGQDECIGLRDVIQHHGLHLSINILRLIRDRVAHQPGKVNQGKRQHMGTVNFQHNRHWGNIFLSSRHLFGLMHNLLPDFIKIGKFYPRKM
mmetsp:Transcript_3070/g.4036  ORF Transcript_3070/g.4036 Transcript_3070/m.4036 type:complete len:205 (-) Transcript_3070:596-1210(-)